MEIKEYAPIVLTVLNRFEHFKRCFESLERCTGANHTDVYVGLDYPPSEKYVEGWKQIDAYLTNKETNNAFKNLYVRRRDQNYGAGGNLRLLYSEIKEITNICIFTEDDNEFSPCFLEYMNKALEKYKDDERVMSVCGYSPFDYNGNENVFFTPQAYAWGLGRWFGKKDEELSEIRNLNALERILKNFKSSMQIYKFRPTILSYVMNQVIHKKIYGDVCITCYCVLNNCFNLFPSKTLVNNYGRDGTGLHCKKKDDSQYINRSISQDTTFELDDIELLERKEIREKVLKISSKKWYGNIAILLRYFIWRVTSKDILSIRLLKKFKK